MALEEGHEVTTFTRSPEKLQVEASNLQVVEGDVQDRVNVEAAVAGAEAVISVLGPTENEPTFAVTKGTQNILRAMEKHGVERLVMSAGAGVRDPEDEPNLINRVINFLLKRFSRWVYEDMVQAVETVRNSEVNWTVVRVPMLTDDQPSGKVKAGYIGKGVGMRVSRADLARFMLEQVYREAFIHQAPVISN